MLVQVVWKYNKTICTSTRKRITEGWINCRQGNKIMSQTLWVWLLKAPRAPQKQGGGKEVQAPSQAFLLLARLQPALPSLEAIPGLTWLGVEDENAVSAGSRAFARLWLG